MKHPHDRYSAALHRVQTAIAVLMGSDPSYKATTPKHMRVGIDMSKSDQAGLAQLLIDKGVFTAEEYVEALAQSAEREADSFERVVQSVTGNRNVRTR